MLKGQREAETEDLLELALMRAEEKMDREESLVVWDILRRYVSSVYSFSFAVRDQMVSG